MDLHWLYTVLYCLYWVIAYPLTLILSLVLLLLYWIALPCIYLGRSLVYVGLIPIHFLAKFETLYIYFGVATLVGLAAGLTIHFISKSTVHFLGLDVSKPNKEKPAVGHSAATYRASRERKKKLDQDLTDAYNARVQKVNPLLREAMQQRSPGARISTPPSPNTTKRRNGLLGTTILEEGESSDEGFGF